MSRWPRTRQEPAGAQVRVSTCPALGPEPPRWSRRVTPACVSVPTLLPTSNLFVDEPQHATEPETNPSCSPLRSLPLWSESAALCSQSVLWVLLGSPSSPSSLGWALKHGKHVPRQTCTSAPSPYSIPAASYGAFNSSLWRWPQRGHPSNSPHGQQADFSRTQPPPR